MGWWQAVGRAGQWREARASQDSQDLELEVIHPTRDLVVFLDPPQQHPASRRLTAVFRLGEAVQAGKRDWVGIFHSGWGSVRNFRAFQWAHSTLPVDGQLNTGRVIFPAVQIAALVDAERSFQLVYVTGTHDVLGVSRPFLVVECPDVPDLNWTMLEKTVSKSPASQVSGNQDTGREPSRFLTPGGAEGERHVSVILDRETLAGSFSDRGWRDQLRIVPDTEPPDTEPERSSSDRNECEGVSNASPLSPPCQAWVRHSREEVCPKRGELLTPAPCPQGEGQAAPQGSGRDDASPGEGRALALEPGLQRAGKRKRAVQSPPEPSEAMPAKEPRLEAGNQVSTRVLAAAPRPSVALSAAGTASKQGGRGRTACRRAGGCPGRGRESPGGKGTAHPRWKRSVTERCRQLAVTTPSGPLVLVQPLSEGTLEATTLSGPRRKCRNQVALKESSDSAKLVATSSSPMGRAPPDGSLVMAEPTGGSAGCAQCARLQNFAAQYVAKLQETLEQLRRENLQLKAQLYEEEAIPRPYTARCPVSAAPSPSSPLPNPAPRASPAVDQLVCSPHTLVSQSRGCRECVLAWCNKTPFDATHRPLPVQQSVQQTVQQSALQCPESEPLDLRVESPSDVSCHVSKTDVTSGSEDEGADETRDETAIPAATFSCTQKQFQGADRKLPAPVFDATVRSASIAERARCPSLQVKKEADSRRSPVTWLPVAPSQDTETSESFSIPTPAICVTRSRTSRPLPGFSRMLSVGECWRGIRRGAEELLQQGKEAIRGLRPSANTAATPPANPRATSQANCRATPGASTRDTPEVPRELPHPACGARLGQVLHV